MTICIIGVLVIVSSLILVIWITKTKKKGRKIVHLLYCYFVFGKETISPMYMLSEDHYDTSQQLATCHTNFHAIWRECLANTDKDDLLLNKVYVIIAYTVLFAILVINFWYGNNYNYCILFI